MNPPIVSAIRYLTKAFQYELDIGEEDLKKIKRSLMILRLRMSQIVMLSFG